MMRVLTARLFCFLEVKCEMVMTAKNGRRKHWWAPPITSSYPYREREREMFPLDMVKQRMPDSQGSNMNTCYLSQKTERAESFFVGEKDLDLKKRASN